jgi:hypothetical protein
MKRREGNHERKGGEAYHAKGSNDATKRVHHSSIEAMHTLSRILYRSSTPSSRQKKSKLSLAVDALKT